MWDPFQSVPALRQPLWIGFAVAALILQGPSFVDDLRPEHDNGVDFVQEWLSARNYWVGMPIYTNHRTSIPRHLNLNVASDASATDAAGMTTVEVDVGVNAHPPTAVLIAIPFGLLDYPDATLVWNLMSLAALAGALWILSRELGVRWTWSCMAPLVILLMVWSPLRQQISQGQLNLLLLFLLTAAWASARNHADARAGAILALAASIKLFPAFLFCYFAVQRRWRAVAAGMITLLAICAVTGIILGSDVYASFVKHSLPQGREYYGDWTNASALGLFHKLFDPPNVHCFTAPLWHNPLLARLGGAVACLGILWLWYRQLAMSRGQGDHDLAFGISVTTMLLLSPLTWDHAFLLLLIPLAIAWVRLSPDSPVRIGWLAGLLLLSIPPVVMWNALIPGGYGHGTATPLHTLTLNSYGLYGLMVVFVVSSVLLADAARGHKEERA